MTELNIASWNANGLRNKVGEMINFMSDNNIDILMINETRLTDCVPLNIKNYKCIRKDQTDGKRGLLMLVRNSIPHKEVKMSNDIALENICIKLASDVYIIAAYMSPNKHYQAKDWDLLLGIGDKVIVAGDLNARHPAWNGCPTNTRGRILFIYSLRNECVIIFPDQPTHYPDNGTSATTIDLVVNKNVSQVSTVDVINRLSSDHNPIIFQLGSQLK